MKRASYVRPPRAGEPRLARDAITAALSFRGITDDIRARAVLTEWSELVGPKIAARTRPDSVTDRVLIVDVVSSAWLQELTMLKPQILPNLIARIGQPTLFDDLKFKLAGRSGRAPAPNDPRRPRPAPPIRPASSPATGAAREAIVRDVERVDDAELRELIARVRIAHDR